MKISSRQQLAHPVFYPLITLHTTAVWAAQQRRRRGGQQESTTGEIPVGQASWPVTLICRTHRHVDSVTHGTGRRPVLPDTAGLRPHHGLSSFARKGLGEFRHVTLQLCGAKGRRNQCHGG